MKEHNYAMRIMDTGGHLLVDDTCKKNLKLWKENGEDAMKKFKYNLKFDWNIVTAMWLITTTT